MIRFFKRNLFLNSLMLLPFTFLVRVKGFLNPVVVIPEDSFPDFLNAIYTFLDQGVYQQILASLLVFFQATMINRMVIKNRIGQGITLIPGLFFIVFASFHPDLLQLSPELIGFTFLLLAIAGINISYKKFNASVLIFNTGFFIAVSAILYTPNLLFIVLGYIGFVIVRSFKISERFQYLAGVLCPYFLYGGYLFLTDQFMPRWNGFLSNLINIPDFSELPKSNISAPLGIILFFIVLAVLSYNSYSSKKSIQAQKKIDVLYWVLLLSIPTIFLASQMDFAHMMPVFGVLAICLSMNFLTIKNTMVQELLFLSCLGGVMAFHFI